VRCSFASGAAASAAPDGRAPEKIGAGILCGPTVEELTRVPYDEKLAERIRAVLGDEQELTERRMFGGLAFLVAGNMCVAASGHGGLLVRLDPDETEEALSSAHASPMDMGRGPVRGWIRIDEKGVADARGLSRWVDRALGYVRTLPAKT
jgi:TfoX/Sxy family transcriptional regulator of competence genes